LNHFGQDLSTISKYGNPTIHLSAWTALPNAIDTPEYQTLLNNLSFLKNYKGQNKLNLFIWGIESEAFIPVIDALKEELQIDHIFIQNHFPIDYQKRREIHLGLV
jgi:hypothetical protein